MNRDEASRRGSRMKSLRKKLVRSSRRGDAHFYIRHGVYFQNTRRRSLVCHCALSRFRRALDAGFFVVILPFAAADFSRDPRIRHTIGPSSSRLSPVCGVSDPLFFLFVIGYVWWCSIAADARRGVCVHRPQRERIACV